MSFLTVSQVARQFGVAPQVISTLFYRRVLSDSVCPVSGGRRLIPSDYVPTIEKALQDRNLLHHSQEAAAQ